MRTFSVAVMALTIVSAYPAHAAGLPRSGVFFYSTECFERESGDAGGGTFKLTRSAAGDRLEIGYGGDGPMEALTATDVHIAPTGPGTVSTLAYTVTFPGQDKSSRFTGTISTTEVRIKDADGGYTAMPRQPLTYKPGECR